MVAEKPFTMQPLRQSALSRPLYRQSQTTPPLKPPATHSQPFPSQSLRHPKGSTPPNPPTTWRGVGKLRMTLHPARIQSCWALEELSEGCAEGGLTHTLPRNLGW